MQIWQGGYIEETCNLLAELEHPESTRPNLPGGRKAQQNS